MARGFAVQDIVAAIERGEIRDPHIEKALENGYDPEHPEISRIQPSSLDTTTDILTEEEAYIISGESAAKIHPSVNHTVKQIIDEIPESNKRRISLVQAAEDGEEVPKENVILIPTEQRLTPRNDQLILGETKSNCGRVFTPADIFSDYSSTRGRIDGRDTNGRTVMPWLLVEPKVFNTIIGPRMSLAQLRWLPHGESRLTSETLNMIHELYPLVYRKDTDGVAQPLAARTTDHGLQLRLDAKGEYSEGVVAFRTIDNPNPIDLRGIEKRKWSDYFTPILRSKQLDILIEKGFGYLAATYEMLRTPPNLCSQLRRRADLSIHADLHYAGFIDNGFNGDLVLEIMLHQLQHKYVNHKVPVSTLDFYHTGVPINPETGIPRLYSFEIGSSFPDQIGAQPSKKFFTEMTYKKAREIAEKAA